MDPAPLPLAIPNPESGRIGALVDAFDTERRLLDELSRVLLSQRDGLSESDLGVLDESVYSAQRIFLTLQQARLRRRTLLELTVGQGELHLSELEDALGSLATEHLIASRDDLLAAAHRLARELRVNRRVIEGAMIMGDQMIRAVAGAIEQPVYTPEADCDAVGSPGALLNTRV